MIDFWHYLKLGLTHVLDWQAYDHVLFLIALVAAYTFSNWKRILVLVSLFTLGHTISLLLANYNMVTVSGKWIEFFIPITILITAISNINSAGKRISNENVGLFYILTIFFGFIHGFGFATYFKMISGGNEILPLIEFSLGVEIAQLIVVTVVLILSFIFQTIFSFSKRDWALVISSMVTGLTIPMLQYAWPL